MGSRYNKGDKVRYKDSIHTVEEIKLIPSEYGKWENHYKINGVYDTVKGGDLKLVERVKKVKRISFKKIDVPTGWKFDKYHSSNFYEYSCWNFENDKDDFVSISRINDVYEVQWGIKRTTYEEFKTKVDTYSETVTFAVKLMEKLSKNEIKVPKLARK